ncbi:MAG TPA: nicotinate phosphoribosyltransferase [Burkholderiaceae bacterium]|nr:nicotinate phosphoribosyltransferase [Burkholderiaceae bacterium]
MYELTMLQGYHAAGMNDIAVFDFFARELPAERNFYLVAGLAQVVEYLADLHFTSEELAWLAGTGRFRPDFLQSLAALRFTGDVDAMPEGTVCFGHEPMLRITASLAQAQFIESRVMNLLHYQTLIASKAVRCVLAADGRTLVDFGLRRAHGAEAGVLSARASYLAGFTGTATALAGAAFGIPVFGTMAHSFIQAHDDEAQAFLAFARAQPDNVTLLIDTYDTEAAAHKVVALAARLRAESIRIAGVRIDSGDLAAHARNVRAILDAGGLEHVTIFASGNLDEHRIAALLARGAPIDGFGVGTRMNVAADAPYLDCAYKLAEYAGIGRRKRSEGKATWPGRKQVFRRFDAGGHTAGDVLTLETDDCSGTPLLAPVMRAGRLVAPLPSLAQIRARVQAGVAALPEVLRGLGKAPTYPVTIAPALAEA